MPFLKDEIAAVSKKIHDACPDVVLETREGYGPRLVGYKRDAHGRILQGTFRVAVAVAGRNREPAYTADVDELIFIWKLQS